MDWDISFSKQVDKFLKTHHLDDTEITIPIIQSIKKLSGQTVSVDLKRMSGEWAGYLRVRSGKKRIIFSVNFTNHTAHVVVFDYRGNVYK